jgi:molybdate transport system substrate-binding protein
LEMKEHVLLNRIKNALRWLTIGCVCLVPANAGAQVIKVMISGGFAAAYEQLAPQFEKTTGTHMETVSGPSMGTTSGAIPVRLEHGESADVVIIVRSALDELAKKGEVVDGSQVDLARSKIAMAVRAGSAIPDISSVAALRRALLGARSVAYSDSASGVYIASTLFKTLGIEKEMANKARQIPAEPVGLVVARGEAEIGFQQMSELLPIPGITVVGPIPDEVQKITVFSAGIVASGKEHETGRALIGFLASPANCETIKQTGLEPAKCPSDPLAQMHIPYGQSIVLGKAKQAADSALAEAVKNNWTMSAAVIGVDGELAYFEKMDGAEIASVQLAIDKARSAMIYRRPTKAFEDALTGSRDGLRVLGLRGAVPLDGGIPLILDGNIVGGIGVSGGTNVEDGQCARAGAVALK